MPQKQTQPLAYTTSSEPLWNYNIIQSFANSWKQTNIHPWNAILSQLHNRLQRAPRTMAVPKTTILQSLAQYTSPISLRVLKSTDKFGMCYVWAQKSSTSIKN